MTATVSNLKHASLNDLNFTASKLRSQMADYDPYINHVSLAELRS